MTNVWRLSVREATAFILEGRLDDDVLAEASKILAGFQKLLRRDNGRFAPRSRSRKKAAWLLVSDAQAALRDATDALRTKRLRGAAALFRTAEESMAFARYFSSRTEVSKTDLVKWYANKDVKHSRVRRWIERTDGPAAAAISKKNYRILSALSHRSYRSILHGGMPAPGGKIHLSDYISDQVIIPLKTSAEYAAVLVWLVDELGQTISLTHLAKPIDVRAVWTEVLGDKLVCSVLTKQGFRCQRLAASGSRRCWQHRYAT